MNKYKKWLAVCIVLAALGIGSIVGSHVCSSQTNGMNDTGISTGAKNRCLAYDEAEDILVVGIHENQIVTFQKEEELWRSDASGAFSEIRINQETGLVYAGNEDNHIYIYQLKDGKLVNDIDVSRRILSIDVSEDGESIAAATSTGSSKANVLLYQTDGTQLLNMKYTVKTVGVKFVDADENLVIANNRGELVKMNRSGEEITSYETNYSVLQMVKNGDQLWVICKDGSYHAFDEDLNRLRGGKVNNSMQAVMRSIGVDKDGQYVAVGTEEGYLFLMNSEDKQIYQAKFDSQITGFAAIGSSIYMTGLGDFVEELKVENLEHAASYQEWANRFLILTVIFFLAAAFAFIMAIPSANRRTAKLFKEIFKQRMAYLLLLPTFILAFLFCYRGVATAFVRAFTNWSTTNNTTAKMDFIGLENFRTMITEGYFLTGMKNLVLVVSTDVLKVITVPLLAAYLVYEIKGDKRKYFHRFLIVLPIVVPGVIGALTWQKIYDPSIGLLNQILEVLHLENLQRVWLGDAKTAIWAVIFMGFPFIGAMAFLVYYGGFLNVGREIEESAKVDGASRWKIFWKIQLPLIRPQLSIMITLKIIAAMQDFNGIFILTGGGPGTATYVPALELYLNVAQFGRYGYACALGVVLFIFTMTVTLINMKLTGEKG